MRQLNTLMQANPDFGLRPATLDLASYIGCALARDSLSPTKRALYHRIWARMSPAAYKRVCDACTNAMAEARS